MHRLKFTYPFKVIMMTCMAVGLLSSCHRHHTAFEYQEISMGAKTAGTKAIVTDKASLIDLSHTGSTGFGVYGYKTINASSFLQFNNILVYPSSGSANADWTYRPKRYWDTNPLASYQFAAYWPHMDDAQPVGGGMYVEEDEKVLTIHDIPNWQEVSVGKDILTATNRGKYRSSDPQEYLAFGSGTVDFSFNHILANLVIKAYYIGIQDNPVKISELTISGASLISTDGEVDYTIPFGGQENAVPAFGTKTTSSTGHQLYPPTSTPATYLLPTTSWFNNDPDPSKQNQYEREEICSWLMVPSTGWSNLKLHVTYTIGEGNQIPIIYDVENITFNTTDNNVEYAGETLPRYKYIVTLQFNSAGAGIELLSVQVADWDEETIETGVYNW